MKLIISRILHAGYLFEYGNTRILMDPIFENPFSINCYAFPKIRFDLERIKNLQIDAVFISHFHDDHFSLESLNLIDRNTPIYMFSVFDDFFEMLRELGFTQVFSLSLNSSVAVGDFEIIPLKALDEDIDSIFHIKVLNFNILNVVDSWIHPSSMKTLSAITWDLALWPFQTMREIEVLSPTRIPQADPEIPIELLDQLKILNSRFIVPSACQFQLEYWSWYNQTFFPITYAQFQKTMEVTLPQTRIIKLNPGESRILEKNKFEKANPLPWIIPQDPELDVDYEFNPSVRPMKTSEIAKRLEYLDTGKQNTVVEYCKKGIIDKFNSLRISLEPYFENKYIWQLTLFDYEGQPLLFKYEIDGNKIKLVDKPRAPVGWTTEIPLVKLYSALEKGESLTSLYLRINDFQFDDAIEAEIKQADIMEDPLIRCLYTGRTGEYQRNQLLNLQSRLNS